MVRFVRTVVPAFPLPGVLGFIMAAALLNDISHERPSSASLPALPRTSPSESVVWQLTPSDPDCISGHLSQAHPMVWLGVAPLCVTPPLQRRLPIHTF
jgi:hypothetical protein